MSIYDIEVKFQVATIEPGVLGNLVAELLAAIRRIVETVDGVERVGRGISVGTISQEPAQREVRTLPTL